MKPPKNFDDDQSPAYNKHVRKAWEDDSSDTHNSADEKPSYNKPSYEGRNKTWDTSSEQGEQGGYGDKPYYKKPYNQQGGGYEKPYYKKPNDQQGGGGYDKPYYKKPYDQQQGGGSGGYDKPYYKKPYDQQQGGGSGGYDKPYYKKPYNQQQGGGSGNSYDKPYYKKPYNQQQGGGYNDYDDKFNKKTWNDNSRGFPGDNEERPSYNPKKAYQGTPPPPPPSYQKPPSNYQKRPYNNQSGGQYQNRGNYGSPPPNEGGYGYQQNRGSGGYPPQNRGNYGGGYQQNRGGGGYPPQNRGGYQQNRGGYGGGGGGYQQPNRRKGPAGGGYQQNRGGGYQEQRYTKRERPVMPEYPTNDFKGEMRLNKYIAHAGICARRKADDLIKDGKVHVNGVLITEMGHRVLHTDEVKVNGEIIMPKRKYVYILLNKPHNVITTAEDEKGRRTVLEFVRELTDERIYPVGRLDRNTTGLLLLTNDGELAQKLSHPSHGVRKVYHAVLDRPISPEHIEEIRNTLTLEDGEAPVDAVDYISEMPPNNVGIEIHIGKNHIVRRIFEHLGYQVKKLDRTRYAMLTKKSLRRGDVRYLTTEEVIFLKHMTDSQ